MNSTAMIFRLPVKVEHLVLIAGTPASYAGHPESIAVPPGKSRVREQHFPNHRL